MGKATGHRRRTRNLSSQRIILEQITWCLFITSKECVGSSGNDVDTAGRVHIIPPDHLEMVRYSFLSVAAVQSSNSTHPHYGIQPTVSTVQPAAFRPQDREQRFIWTVGANLTDYKARRPKCEDLALGGRQISSMSTISVQNIYRHL